jgi:hypothetical protein
MGLGRFWGSERDSLQARTGPQASCLTCYKRSMDKSIRKFTNFEEMKAEEYRYWQSRPVHERVAAVSELTDEGYETEGVQGRCFPITENSCPF